MLLPYSAGNGLHPGGALTTGHPRPAAPLLPLAGRASAARDEELRNAHQSSGQVRELQTNVLLEFLLLRAHSMISSSLNSSSSLCQVHPAHDPAGP